MQNAKKGLEVDLWRVRGYTVFICCTTYLYLKENIPMPINRPLLTDSDFQEAIDRKLPVRVFQDDHLVNSGATVIRFTDSDVVIQSRVSDLTYYSRSRCEFFEVRA